MRCIFHLYRSRRSHARFARGIVQPGPYNEKLERANYARLYRLTVDNRRCDCILGGMRDDASGMPTICADSSLCGEWTRERDDSAMFVLITSRVAIGLNRDRLPKRRRTFSSRNRNRISRFLAFTAGMRMDARYCQRFGNPTSKGRDKFFVLTNKFSS